MKRWFISMLFVIAAHSARSALFINMDFEGVMQPLPPPDVDCGSVPASLALPGWHVPINCYGQTDTVLYNNIYLSLVSVSVFSRDFAPVIQGSYSVLLISGLISPLPTGSAASIVQTGLVPFGARSIELKADGGVNSFQVFLGGTLISLIPRFTGPNYTLYAGDITGHVGREEELRITVPYIGIAPNGQSHATALDDIRFSPFAVPEPGVLAFLGLGLAGLLACRLAGTKN